MKRILAVLALMMFAAVSSQAGEGANFVSGNKNNDGYVKPRKVYNPKDPNRAPGFWDKEWKRSGLDQTIGKAKWNPFADTGNYLKKKEEAYRAKNPAGADKA